MVYLKLKTLILVGSMALSHTALSEEKAESSAPKSDGVSRELIEFNNKEGRLNSLENRIKDAHARFNQVLAEKKRTTDVIRQKQLATELMSIAKERNSYVTEYNDLRQEILYRYPNRGQEIDKRFIPRQHRSVAEMENATDLDRQLTKVKVRIGEKYAPLMPVEDISATPPSSPNPEKPETEKRLRLVK